MSAPDRIWIEVAPQFPAKIPPFPSWNDDEADPSMNQTVEYVRADLCAPQDERVQALVDAAERLADLWDKDLADRIGPATRQLRAALRDLEQGEG